MRKILSLIFVSFFLVFVVGVPARLASEGIAGRAFAEDSKCADPSTLGLDDITKCLDQLNSAKQSSINATAPLLKQVNGMKARLTFIENDLITKKKSIEDGYKNLAKQQLQLNAAIRDYYIKSYYNSPLTVFLSADSASDITQILTYQKKITDQDKLIITNIALSIQGLRQQQVNLETEQTNLASAKVSLDKIISQAQAYQSTLSSQISVLSAKQQAILSQRLASLNLPVSAYTTQGGCSSDLTNGKDPGFSGGFGFFSFGVPHRVGMSQYGAKGRADSGSSYTDILSFYFPNTQISNVDQNQPINVIGTNEYGQSFNGDDGWNLETYVKHIYEMPTNWDSKALQAQAIAARSYALATKTNLSGKDNAVCPSQSCQVVKKEINSGAWQAAVDATAGQILTSGGQPIQAWFSSTAGGYVHSSGSVWGGDKPWTKNAADTTNGSASSFDDLKNNAYDKSSPWFYCDWGGRASYGGTAWLKPDEVADIVNTLLLTKADSGTKEHLYQTDKPNPAGTDNWDAARVKSELQNRGITPLDSVSSVSVGADFGSGVTNSININGQSFSGSEFKDRFNLRAPSNINIVGPLYNVERK